MLLPILVYSVIIITIIRLFQIWYAHAFPSDTIANEVPNHWTRPVRKHSKESRTFGVCIICRHPIARSNNAISCPQCNTRFHLSHLKMYLKEKNECPVCNSPLDQVLDQTIHPNIPRYEKLNECRSG